jgi:sulfoxide reductase heme-binding subunit YedZ
MVRRLGAQRWKALHRLVYVASALALAHLAWTDADHRSPLERTKYALLPFAILLLLRIVPLQALRRKLRQRDRAASGAHSSGAGATDE